MVLAWLGHQEGRPKGSCMVGPEGGATKWFLHGLAIRRSDQMVLALTLQHGKILLKSSWSQADILFENACLNPPAPLPNV